MNVTYLANILNQKNQTCATLDVQSQLAQLKQSLHKTVEEKKTNVKPLVAENERLSLQTSLLKDKTKATIENVTNLKEKVLECKSTIDTTTDILNTVNFSINALDRLINIYNLLNKFKEYEENKLFFESAKCLKNIEVMIAKCEDLKTLNIFKILCHKVELAREEIMVDIKVLWNTSIKINDVTENKTKIFSVTVIKDDSSTIDQIVKSALLLQNTNLLEKFFNNVKDSILLPAIKFNTEISIEEKNDTAVLCLTIKEDKPTLPYWKIFEVIKTVVYFIKSSISENLVEPMGQSIAPEVVSSLVKLSLSEAVLSPSGKLNSFEEIVRHAESFQSSLQEFGFLPKQYVSFLNETDSAGLFFAEKMYLSYLDRGRLLMKSDLHHIVQAEDIAMPNWSNFPPNVVTFIRNHFNINNKSKLLLESESISKSAQEILELIDTIVSELIKTDENHNKRLMFAVRNIFEMYGAIVPLHQAKLLSTIPQQVAIFHNNCLHFSYRLILLASECLEEWPKNLHGDYHIYVDQAVEMRHLAVTSLENYVSSQRNQIISIITESGLVRLRTNPKLEADTDKYLRQCIRQLELLKNVWTPILSDTVYSNSMGFLIDELTQAIVAQVTLVEDISQNTATDLVKILTNVQDRLPAVFKDSREIHRLCRKWSRFKELIFVLNNNLDAFSERWAAGMGPLANEFSKAEAQMLVRALFRNTERRAAVLSHIYNS